jgi:hypothetical protein
MMSRTGEQVLATLGELEAGVNSLALHLNILDEKIETISNTVNPWPQAYKIYKGAGGKNGALQIDLTPIHRSKRDIGAVFVTAAPTVGLNDYDWDQKIVMALNLGDIEKILNTIYNKPKDKDGRIQLKLFHDPKAGSSEARQSAKTFHLDKLDYGWMIGLRHTMGDKEHKVRLPISDGELLIIKSLLEHATARILGW